MTTSVTCTVLFADLRGSTSLYESLGNQEAAAVVTHSVAVVARIVEEHDGRVIKTLGDGLMAIFYDASSAVLTAEDVHESLERVLGSPRAHRRAGLRVQIALAYGDVIEVGGDCFGDAVNVAARLLDHAGDNETLATSQTLDALPGEMCSRFRRLEKLHLRGRLEPVELWRLEPPRTDAVSTMFGETAPINNVPDGLRLSLDGTSRIHTLRNLPVVLGRSHEATYCVDDSRVSRMHARIEWTGGNFQVTDLSSNGTFVRFGRQPQVVTLRRGTCTLHGQGIITLGVNPGVIEGPAVSFEVLRFEDTDTDPVPIP
ncbi:MAG: adenylate/guanylate cyclase domain-containing protein [Burkholderiales bacterium]